MSLSKKLLIVTGPQGSGNHLFSRVLSLHHDVGGWKELLDNYWIPSDLETFAKYWVYPEQLHEFNFSSHDYWLANVSCPFMYDGVRYVPKILEFAKECKKLGIAVEICIIVRDENINREQQLRVRKEVTLPIALNYFEDLLESEFPVHYLDHEAFFLHRGNYLRYLQRILKFPIAWDNPNVLKFIEDNPNNKYIKYVDKHWLDEQVWQGIKSKQERGL